MPISDISKQYSQFSSVGPLTHSLKRKSPTSDRLLGLGLGARSVRKSRSRTWRCSVLRTNTSQINQTNGRPTRSRTQLGGFGDLPCHRTDRPTFANSITRQGSETFQCPQKMFVLSRREPPFPFLPGRSGKLQRLELFLPIPQSLAGGNSHHLKPAAVVASHVPNIKFHTRSTLSPYNRPTPPRVASSRPRRRRRPTLRKSLGGTLNSHK
jgi:hypothetical protein